jgi:hypothetical protein
MFKEQPIADNIHKMTSESKYIRKHNLVIYSMSL